MLRWLWDIYSLGVTSKSFQYQRSCGSSQEPIMNNEIAIYPSIRSKYGETIKGTILVRAVENVTLTKLIFEICMPFKSVTFNN